MISCFTGGVRVKNRKTGIGTGNGWAGKAGSGFSAPAALVPGLDIVARITASASVVLVVDLEHDTVAVGTLDLVSGGSVGGSVDWVVARHLIRGYPSHFGDARFIYTR